MSKKFAELSQLNLSQVNKEVLANGMLGTNIWIKNTEESVDDMRMRTPKFVIISKLFRLK